MINYSIVMRSVNANLLEINQAKSRINQAKKDGKEPDKKDTDLVKTEKQNAFAISQYTDVMTIEKFAKHITSHGSVYSRADISAILYITVDCMREMLLEGKNLFGNNKQSRVVNSITRTKIALLETFQLQTPHIIFSAIHIYI